MPNPFAAYPITDDWEAHIARGSLGGHDWGTPAGTPITAFAPGHVTYYAGNGSGGYIITLAFPDGYRAEFLHCSAFEGGERDVSTGEVLGYTGGIKNAPGAGSSTGPHVHAHIVDPAGNRESILPWLADPTPEKKENDMAQGAFYRVADGQPGAGAIYWQEKPNTAFTVVTFPTWTAYATQGNKYANLKKAEIDALIKTYGLVTVPPIK